MNWDLIRLKAKSWAKEAGMFIRKNLQTDLHIDYKKSRSDLVTNMDRETEQLLISKIKSEFPEHKIISEEGFGDDIGSEQGVIWLINPIDGTMNFVHLQRHFSISLAAYKDGKPMVGVVYDVMQDEMYDAVRGEGSYLNGEKLLPLKEVPIEDAVISINAVSALSDKHLAQLVRQIRGTRSFGSAAIEMAYIAANRTDGYISRRLAPWDFAAGKLLVEEVGGIVSNIAEKSLHFNKMNSMFVCKPGLHEHILSNYLTYVK